MKTAATIRILNGVHRPAVWIKCSARLVDDDVLVEIQAKDQVRRFFVGPRLVQAPGIDVSEAVSGCVKVVLEAVPATGVVVKVIGQPLEGSTDLEVLRSQVVSVDFA